MEAFCAGSRLEGSRMPSLRFSRSHFHTHKVGDE